MANNECCTWDFTLPETDNPPAAVRAWLKEKCKKWCFQLEEGDGGYIHYQGRISLKVKSRHGPQRTGAHWSPTTNENRDNNFYVTKPETRINGPWKDTDPYIPLQVANIEL